MLKFKQYQAYPESGIYENIYIKYLEFRIFCKISQEKFQTRILRQRKKVFNFIPQDLNKVLTRIRKAFIFV